MRIEIRQERELLCKPEMRVKMKRRNVLECMKGLECNFRRRGAETTL